MLKNDKRYHEHAVMCGERYDIAFITCNSVAFQTKYFTSFLILIAFSAMDAETENDKLIKEVTFNLSLHIMCSLY
jgi:hypothetical protein